MKLEKTPAFWKTFLAQHPDFVGFGDLSAPTLILSDAFLVDPNTDELEVMFQLEDVGAQLGKIIANEAWETDPVAYLPDYAKLYTTTLAQVHSLGLSDAPIFCIPLASSHLYFEDRNAWRNRIREKLTAYQELIYSFSTIMYTSAYLTAVEVQDLVPQ